MSEADQKITMTVSMAWWLPIYVHGVALCAALTRREPDWDKVGRVICRAMRFRATPKA